MAQLLRLDVVNLCCLIACLYCGVNACGTQPNDAWTVQLPSTTTPISTSFGASINGESSDGEYSIAITDNAGNVTQSNETTRVIVRNQIPFGGQLVLYSLIGTIGDSILEGWAYCTGSHLTSLWLETTEGTIGFTNSTVSGSCSITNDTTSVNLVTDAECLEIIPPSEYPTIDGSDQIYLQSGSVGNVTLGSEEFNLLPFAVVDCSDCAATTAKGWYEIHSVMTGKTSSDVCLGIFYLFLTCGSVEVEYVQCFMGSATNQTFNASYDLSNVLKNTTEVAKKTCEAIPSSSSSIDSSIDTSDASDLTKSSIFLTIALAVGFMVMLS
ncbi:hypothetical protein AB5N19_10326 [Seiridium cardinale]